MLTSKAIKSNNAVNNISIQAYKVRVGDKFVKDFKGLSKPTFFHP